MSKSRTPEIVLMLPPQRYPKNGITSRPGFTWARAAVAHSDVVATSATRTLRIELLLDGEDGSRPGSFGRPAPAESGESKNCGRATPAGREQRPRPACQLAVRRTRERMRPSRRVLRLRRGQGAPRAVRYPALSVAFTLCQCQD